MSSNLKTKNTKVHPDQEFIDEIREMIGSDPGKFSLPCLKSNNVTLVRKAEIVHVGNKPVLFVTVDHAPHYMSLSDFRSYRGPVKTVVCACNPKGWKRIRPSALWCLECKWVGTRDARKPKAVWRRKWDSIHADFRDSMKSALDSITAPETKWLDVKTMPPVEETTRRPKGELSTSGMRVKTV